jgi:hypothetical protein
MEVQRSRISCSLISSGEVTMMSPIQGFRYGLHLLV